MANKQGILEQIKKSSFSKFLEKVFLNNDKFVSLESENILNNKKQRTIMANFSTKQKQEMVFAMATLLLIGGIDTSNKEIKDELHTLYPGIELAQTEVSTIMSDFFNEGKFSRENKSTGGQYFKYMQPTVVASVPDASVTPAPDNSTAAVPVTILPTMIAIAQTGGASAVLGPIGQHPVDFLKKLDDNLYIAFTKGKTDYSLTNVTDKYDARRLFKVTGKAKHNDVRTITLKTYLKRAKV